MKNKVVKFLTLQELVQRYGLVPEVVLPLEGTKTVLVEVMYTTTFVGHASELVPVKVIEPLTSLHTKGEVFKISWSRPVFPKSDFAIRNKSCFFIPKNGFIRSIIATRSLSPGKFFETVFDESLIQQKVL